MMRARPAILGLPAWPATAWVLVPTRGQRWINYIRGPAAFIWIRRADDPGQWLRLYLCRPFPIDPDADYEILNRGYASDGVLTVSNLVTTIDTTPLAGAVDTGDPNRKNGGSTVVVASLEPMHGGLLRARFRCVTSVATVTANPFRLTTEGLRRVSLWLHNIGPDTITFYAATFPADAPLQYSLPGHHFLGLALAIAAGTTGYASVESSGSTALTATTALHPLREMLSPLLAVTFTGGSTCIVDVLGEPQVGP